MSDFDFDDVRLNIGQGVDVEYDGSVNVVYEDHDDFSQWEAYINLSIEDLEKILFVAKARRAAYQRLNGERLGEMA